MVWIFKLKSGAKAGLTSGRIRKNYFTIKVPKGLNAHSLAVFQLPVLCPFLTTFPWPRSKTSWGPGRMWRRIYQDEGRGRAVLRESNCIYTRLRNCATAHVNDVVCYDVLKMVLEKAHLQPVCSCCAVSCGWYKHGQHGEKHYFITEYSHQSQKWLSHESQFLYD